MTTTWTPPARHRVTVAWTDGTVSVRDLTDAQLAGRSCIVCVLGCQPVAKVRWNSYNDKPEPPVKHFYDEGSQINDEVIAAALAAAQRKRS